MTLNGHAAVDTTVYQIATCAGTVRFKVGPGSVSGKRREAVAEKEGNDCVFGYTRVNGVKTSEQLYSEKDFAF